MILGENKKTIESYKEENVNYSLSLPPMVVFLSENFFNFKTV